MEATYAPALTTRTLSPSTPAAQRVDVLDVLRGLAVIGMFLVHFTDYSAEGVGAADKLYQQIVGLFFEERFWFIF